MPDDQLAAKPDWIRQVLDRYERSLVAYAARITGELDLARDVVQETFLRLCRERRPHVENHVAEWLFTVCRNRALDVRRKENRMTPLADVEMDTCESREAGPAEIIENEEATSDVLRLLATLPGNQQEVLRLKFQHGLSYRDIAGVTKLTVTNVGYLIHTGLKTLRKQLTSTQNHNAPAAFLNSTNRDEAPAALRRAL